MKKRESNTIKKNVLCAMFVAIILVMTFIPFLGYIEYVPGGIAITTIHIPVIIGALFLGWKYGTFLGGVWGVSCLIKAFIEPIPGNIPFQNPLVSVVPRIIVGFVAAAVFSLCASKTVVDNNGGDGSNKKINKKRGVPHPIAAGIAALAATLTNAVLVVSMLGAFGALGNTDIATVFGTVIMTLAGINGIIETAVAVVLAAAIYSPLEKTYKEHFEK